MKRDYLFGIACGFLIVGMALCLLHGYEAALAMFIVAIALLLTCCIIGLIFPEDEIGEERER